MSYFLLFSHSYVFDKLLESVSCGSFDKSAVVEDISILPSGGIGISHVCLGAGVLSSHLVLAT